MSEAATGLEEILPASERTQTIEVVTRMVVGSGDGFKEVEKPEKVFVRPMPGRKWAKSLSLVTTLLQCIPQEGVSFKNETEMLVFAGALLGQMPDEALSLCAMAIDKEVGFFDLIDLKDTTKIVVAVFEVNKDFFIREVWPLVEPLIPQAKEAVTEIIGQTPLPS
jgi:hypothetical protein